MQSDAFTFEYEVRAFQCNCFEEMSLKTLAHFVQDIADRHSAAYSIGRDFLMQHNIAWVLVNHHIQIDELPKMNDTIKIRTWVSEFKKVSSRREFTVERHGKIIVRGVCLWVGLNLQTKKLANIYELMKDYEPIREFAVETTFPKIKAFENMQVQKSYTSIFDDLDPNLHVNNGHYLNWAYDAFGAEWIKTKRIKEFEINYKHESFHGDTLEYKVHIDNDISTQIATKDDGSEAVAIRIKWEDK